MLPDESRTVFGKRFFDLQLSFAEKVRDLSGVSLERALFEYTNLYVRFGLGRAFDSGHEGWQDYLRGLRKAADQRDWTYRFYLRNPEATTAPPLDATFGCFSYALASEGHVRLHFRNAQKDGGSPLGSPRIEQRRAELGALFEHLRARAGDEVPVIGRSWLYNLEAYRRLFPTEYVASARVLRRGFRSMPLWGQFLDRRGEVKAPMTEPFLKSLAETARLDQLDECFPFKVLTVRAPARLFHGFYGAPR